MNASGSKRTEWVLVTGGAGFLGAWIIKLLYERDIGVRVFDRTDDRRLIHSIAPEATAELQWVTGDIADTHIVREAAQGCDTVIHLAGLMTPTCRTDPVRGAMVNVIGTLNVFEAAKENRISHITYTSSGGVYGLEDDQTPVPITHYGAFKLANEGNARAYWADDGISSFGIRPFVIYGPGRKVGLTAGISLACAAAARGEAYTVPFRGPVALIYVEDVAQACVQALLQQPGGARTANLSGHDTTVKSAVKMIGSGRPNADISISGDLVPSLSSAKNEWQTCGLELPAEHSLKAGLERTIAFYSR